MKFRGQSGSCWVQKSKEVEVSKGTMVEKPDGYTMNYYDILNSWCMESFPKSSQVLFSRLPGLEKTGLSQIQRSPGRASRTQAGVREGTRAS